MKKKMKIFKNKLDSLIAAPKEKKIKKGEKHYWSKQIQDLLSHIIKEKLYLIDQEKLEVKTRDHTMNKNKELGLIETINIHSFNTFDKLDRIINMVQDNQISLQEMTNLFDFINNY